MRVIEKFRRPKQLGKRYLHHILGQFSTYAFATEMGLV